MKLHLTFFITATLAFSVNARPQKDHNEVRDRRPLLVMPALETGIDPTSATSIVSSSTTPVNSTSATPPTTPIDSTSATSLPTPVDSTSATPLTTPAPTTDPGNPTSGGTVDSSDILTTCIPQSICVDGITCGHRFGGCYDRNFCTGTTSFYRPTLSCSSSSRVVPVVPTSTAATSSAATSSADASSADTSSADTSSAATSSAATSSADA